MPKKTEVTHETPVPYDEQPIGRPYKTIEDYKTLAAKHGLYFLGNGSYNGINPETGKPRIKPGGSPRNIKMTTRWFCPRCHRVLEKSYHTLLYWTKKGGAACPCRNGMSLSENDYRKAGKLLNLKYVNVTTPKNNRQKVTWENYLGQRFEASYLEITGWGKPIGKKIRVYLEPDIFEDVE